MSGTISGTVNAGPGKQNFNVTVTDTASHSYNKWMAIDVVGVPAALLPGRAHGVGPAAVSSGGPVSRFNPGHRELSFC